MMKTYALHLTYDELKALNLFLRTDAQDIYNYEIQGHGEVPYDPGQLDIVHEKVSTALMLAQDTAFYFTFEGEFGFEQREIFATDVRTATLKLALECPQDVGADGAVAWEDSTGTVHDQGIDW